MALKDNPRKGIASLALLEVGLLELAGVVVTIALIFLVLNYFNIISLSQLYPDKLGFLPHQPFSQRSQVTDQAIENSDIPPLSCPVKSSTCGETIIQNGKYVGIGFQLPPESEFFVAIPGTALFKLENIEGAANHVNIAGTVEAQGYEAIYDFFGTPVSSTSAEVDRGNLLGNVNEGSFISGRGINLMFKLNGPNGQNIELKPSDFQLN